MAREMLELFHDNVINKMTVYNNYFLLYNA
jgi:hypothetical protein